MNFLKNALSYRISNITGKAVLYGKPYSISIEPTTSCNLRCPECPSGQRKFSRPTGMLSMETYKKIIDSTFKDLIYIILYFQGEPYLNNNFFDFIKYAKKKNIYTATSTNAHFLNNDFAKKTVESGLDNLIISLDGIDQQSYSAYRNGGQFEKVVDGIKNIVSLKKELKSSKPYIIVQFLVLKTNENDIEEIKKLSKELEVDELQLKTAQFYDFCDGNPLMPKNSKYCRYKKTEAGYVIKNKLFDRCYRMWSSCVFTWDGNVIPCCFDKDADYCFGNIKDKSFENIWTNDKYYDFRRKILKSRKSIDICRNCTEGM